MLQRKLCLVSIVFDKSIEKTLARPLEAVALKKGDFLRFAQEVASKLW